MGSLPKALAARGHRVMVVAPRYRNYAEAFDTSIRKAFPIFGGDHEVGYFHAYLDGVDFVFVDHPSFHHVGDDIYSGDRASQHFRFALLSRAALEAAWHVPCGGCPYGDHNTVFVANDWQAALVPVYLQAYYRDHGKMLGARAIQVVHNMAHQGRGPAEELDGLFIPDHYRGHFMLDDPIGGEHMNILKAGLAVAHRIVAVSHGYAWEIQTDMGGWGLAPMLRDQSWKVRGIVNGIDYSEWNPETDQFLQSDGYCNYGADWESVSGGGKVACKAALQRQLGLPERAEVPLLGFIGRLDHQKGVDQIFEAAEWLLEMDVQLVMLGSGREDMQDTMRHLENSHRDKCRGWVGFSVEMAHRINAGCDILLMPSRFEPCGLNQLYAMRYGTVPVVHAVGGLRDTVQHYDPYNDSGTGWSYEGAETNNLKREAYNALLTFWDYRDAFQRMQLRGMHGNFTWDHAAFQYEEVLVAAKFDDIRY